MSIRYRFHKVQSIRWKDHRKTVRLSNGRDVILPLSACVTEEEAVSVQRDGTFVRCTNGLARLLPSYVATEAISVGALRLELVVKEITEIDELAAYRSLAMFHYRDQPLFGRTARLIVRSFHPAYPKTIGYIELATPFYMNKARASLLNRPFQDSGIEWRGWDKGAARKYINSVVRIARCVIYPEFRGVGLGQLLVKHAREFARERWQVGGLKPCFLEISADMLRYVPFAQHGGLHFIGETQGNLERVAKDLDYLLQNRKRVRQREIVREEAFGIVDQQVSRMNKAATIMKENGWSVDQFIDRVRKVAKSRSLRDLNLLRQVLSLPKPTYLGGLTQKADRFVMDGIKLLNPKNGFRPSLPRVNPLSSAIAVSGLTITHASTVSQSRNTSAIQQAFGISPSAITHEIIRDLSFSVLPGQIAMIVGPSGSGKTTLLRHLSEATRNGVQGVRVPSNYKPAVFTPLRSQRPLIDALNGSDVATALQLLGVVGLSDAFVYLKRFNELSAGQQYRAMLANMIRSGSNVWIADEFCVNLDLIAANSVARRLHDLAKRLNAALIVATPQPELIVRSLQPDVVIRLTTAWENEVLSGSEFLSRPGLKSPTFRLPSLRVGRRAIKQIRDHKPAIALVREVRSFEPGPIRLLLGSNTLLAMATDVGRATPMQIAATELREAGYSSKRQFLSSLGRRGFSPDREAIVVHLSPIP